MAASKSPKQHIDEYINEAPDFAKPICTKIRVLKAEPTMIEEWK